MAGAEETWHTHGGALYRLACALLGDRSRAEVAVAQGISDFCARHELVPARDRGSARRELGRIIYWRCSEVITQPLPPREHASLPPAMVWLRETSMLQRSSLALCLFGGHTYREAADLLGLPATTLASLLRSGLLDLAVAVGPVAVLPPPSLN